ncbi:IST1 homolog isoform X1 [Oculina patagonica]
MGFNKQKLKVNLKLAINRLKLLEKKKTELAQKARREIADYINNGKEERARIRVEHIIREDYLVEAMEMLELYCDLLLARFGLIETQQYCDEGMVEAVTTLMWSAPRLQSDVQELRVISDQLGLKYGKKFAHEASINSNETVNKRLILKLSPQPPPKTLVENYLIEIARSHGVAFEPDPSVMGDLQLPDDDMKRRPPDDNNSGGGGGGGGGGPGRIGFEGYGAGFDGPGIPAMTGGSMGYAAYPPPAHGNAPPYPTGPPEAPPSYPPEKKLPPYPGGPLNSHNVGPPPPAPHQPPPPSAPRPSSGPSFPDLPAVPTDLPNLPDSVPGANSAGGEDVDFDDLTRRFEDLKKKK